MQQTAQAVNHSLKDIQLLVQQGHIQVAWQQLAAFLSVEFPQSEALYLACVCQRYLKNNQQALTFAQQLIEKKPNYGRAYQELGHIYRTQQQWPQAVDNYQLAVKFNPALKASWQQLQQLCTQQVSGIDKALVEKQLAYFEKLPPVLLSVQSMIYEQRLLKAEQLCRQFLTQQPQHVEAMRLLAQIAGKLNVLDDAEFLLESALSFAPENVWLQYDYVQILHRRQRYAQAYKNAQALLTCQPDNPSFMLTFANQCVAIGKHQQALEYYAKVQQALPDQAEVYLVTGHAHKTIGNRENAERAYQQAYQCRPDYGDAFWSLANLKNYQFSEQEINQLQVNINQACSDDDKIHSYFALGKAFEDKQLFEQSFNFYQQGNQLKAQQVNFDRQQLIKEMQLQRDTFTPEFINNIKGWGENSADPIFILGMPRAGSTLLEQIIASHSQVDGTLELPDIMAIAHQLNGRRSKNQVPKYPACLNDMDEQAIKALGEKYLKQTQVHRGNAPFFIDKMPNNFRHIGLIKTILPNAKIIDARRSAMACCFSNYKQLYAEGQDFSYDIENLASYYQEYLKLMAHWHQLYPEQILTVEYEQVVTDFDGQITRIFNYLNLPIEEACKEFHQTERAVRTASSEQVRQPLYRQGIDQWQAFQPYLTQLEELLSK